MSKIQVDLESFGRLLEAASDAIKASYEMDERSQNAAMVTLQGVDHTLGNLITSALARQPHIEFAGYRMPRPDEPVVVMRVQTDGSVTPKEAVEVACAGLIHELFILDQRLTSEWHLRDLTVSGDTW